MVFICLELLRGHFRTGQAHLLHGLNILQDVVGSSKEKQGTLLLDPTRDSVDDWIVEIFSKLHVQTALFEQRCCCSIFPLQVLDFNTTSLKFVSPHEAWRHMEHVLNKILHLSERSRSPRMSMRSSPDDTAALHMHQQNIQSKLDQWVSTLEASRVGTGGQAFEGFAYWMLNTYHSMATSIAGTCLRSLEDESIFDSYTKRFVCLIEQSVNNRKTRSLSVTEELSGYKTEMSRSVVDIGWIPPLYYTALYCRVHRVRLQAIRLLELTSHREGIWDASIAACVARRVMEVEEESFYQGVDTADDFPLSSSPGFQDLSLPTLPQSHRILGVRVCLPDGPLGSVILFYEKKQVDGIWKAFSEGYTTSSGRWMENQNGKPSEFTYNYVSGLSFNA